MGASGAGDDDVAVEHRVRISKVRRWLGRDATRVQIGCLFLMLRVLESLTYYLMGGERQEGRNRQPGSVPKADQALPAGELVDRVRRALVAFAKSVHEYTVDDSDCRFFLRSIGVPEDALDGDFAMRTFRRHMLGASAGVHRRLWMRLDAFPVRLWLVVDQSAPEDVRRRCAEEFCALPGCCVGAFGRGLQKVCPTAADLLSTTGQCIIRGWLRALQWSIYASEKEHASCRRLCQGHGPARNWTLVARERVMEAARTVHVERCCFDPAGVEVQSRGAKRAADEISTAGAAPPESEEAPLHDAPPEVPRQLAPWSDKAAQEQREVAMQSLGSAPDDATALAPLPASGGGADAQGVGGDGAQAADGAADFPALTVLTPGGGTPQGN